MAALDDDLVTASRALDALVDADLDGCMTDELNGAVLALQRLRCQVEVAEARLLSRWDARRCWQPDGAKTGAAWLAWKQRLPISEARRRLRHARAVRDLPAVEQAWVAGEIDRTHLATMLSKRTPRTRDAFSRDHEVLLDAARTHRFTEFQRRCDRWELTVDPDGAEQGADADRQAREVHLSQSFQGMWFGRMTLDPISGTIIETTLKIIERELFDADWAQAKARLDREPLITELGRTPAQRRADALVEMATRARTAPTDGRRPAPLFTIVCGLETFTGPILELFNRTVLTPGSAARWLTDAEVERIVFSSPSRVIDVSMTTRFFRGALRRAIEVRDRTCYHPSCDEIPERQHIDHIHEASKGGPTTQTNGRPACAFHNLRRNHHPDPDEDEHDPA